MFNSKDAPNSTLRSSDTDHFAMLLDGAWHNGSNSMEVRNPEDSSIIATVPRSTVQEAHKATEAAFAARLTARAMPVHQRVSVLLRAAELVADEAERFARMISLEGIKTIREARLEVARCAATLRLCSEEASRLLGDTVAFNQRPGSSHRSGYAIREPVGVVLAITPFNDPLNLSAHKVGPAIAAGNAVILKPHERTPLSALMLAHVLIRAGLPHDVLQVVTGLGSEIGQALVSSPLVRMISFTGGQIAGRKVVADAGFKKLSLELGGNCPTIVMQDADLSRAVEACASGAFWAAGQNCLHVQRIYIHKSVYGRFRDALVARTQKLQGGPKLAQTTDMGCLIDNAAAARVAGAVRSAQISGARVLTGGTCQGTYFSPTVIEKVPDSHLLAANEIFGPVTLLFEFDEFSEAIRRANAPDFGLQAAIFTRNMDTAMNAIDLLEAGAVMINDSTDFRLDAMPFGGIKGSGLGREGVRSAALDMSEMKVACFSRGNAQLATEPATETST